MKLLSSKQRWLAGAVLIVLLLFLVRPGAARLKARIATSISAAVGRPVEIGSVHIRLLPRPGFDLENLVVHEDPVFGSEPMLRASEVTAALRLTSLIRGRLEIARLNLSEPSLNLVRAQNGRWNLEALVERVQHASLAPTSKAKSEPRPGFPYIECNSGRINFKVGQEKKPYALTNADFALWQDSENAWGVRLEAQPFRSDLNLSDIGVLQVNGTWRRAASLRDTPLQFTVEWNRPQLGQLTKFFTGTDQGWRGTAKFDVNMSGTPANLKVVADAGVRDFRRYDVVGSGALRLAAHCEGAYSSVDRIVHDVDCRGPVGAGAIHVTGDVGSLASHNYSLEFNTENVPVAAFIALARQAKKNFPNDLVSSGIVEANLTVRGSGAPQGAAFEGAGNIVNLHLSSASTKAEFAPGTIPFVFAANTVKEKIVTRKPAVVVSRNSVGLNYANVQFPFTPHIEIGTFPVAPGRTKPVLARGWVDISGYSIALAGDVGITRATRLARLFGLPAPRATAEGEAQIDLQIAGLWPNAVGGSGAEATQTGVTGIAHLQNVQAEMRGVDGPVEISSAEVQFMPNETRVTKLIAKAAHAEWTGSLQVPRNCKAPEDCIVRFDLSAGEIDLTKVSQWVNPRSRQQPWYRLLLPSEQNGSSFLATVHAEGKLAAGRVLIHSSMASHVLSDVTLADGKLHISNLSADFLGGKYQGEWTADFSAKPPVYTSTGGLKDIALIQLNAISKGAEIAGTASSTYELKASGMTAGDFWQAVDGTLQFDLRDASLARLSLTNEPGPLKITRWQGHARMRDGKIEIKDGQLNSAAGVFWVKGAASLRRELDFKLIHSSPSTLLNTSSGGYTISGTLTQPRVVANPETQAKLKQQ